MDEEIKNGNEQFTEQGKQLPRIEHVTGMYKNWFLDYASYVIVERAVPEILDGDYPHTQRGCDAQAWGTSELLRVWLGINGKPL